MSIKKQRKMRTVPARHQPSSSNEPRMLSADEKRELILAHAAARGKRPASWGFGYYIGIAASCLVVVTGWWLTIGTDLRQPLPVHTSLLQTITSGLEQLKSGLQADSNSGNAQAIKNQVESMKRQYQQAMVEAAAMQSTAEKIKAMTATSSAVTSNR